MQKKITWKISRLKWLNNFIISFAKNTVFPFVAYEILTDLGLSIDADTYFAIFIVLLAFRIWWILMHPPRYRLLELVETEEETKK